MVTKTNSINSILNSPIYNQLQADYEETKEDWYDFKLNELFPFKFDNDYILCLRYANNNITLADKVYRSIDLYELYFNYTLKLAVTYKKAKPKK